MKKTLTVKKQGDEGFLSEQNVQDESIITVGNNPSATLQLKDSRIAPEQFVIISENEQVLLMNRADGTLINDELLDLGSKVELQVGDSIKIGEFQIFLTDSNGSRADDTLKLIKESEENITVVSKEDGSNKDFSTVLNNVKEEDSFYFHIVSREDIVERILFDSEDIWLGTSFAECAIRKDKSELDEIYAFIKKDWSGAVIHPEESEEILLNGEKLTEASRLKNEDELVLIDDFADDEDDQTKITFHEPVVLLALNSILPEDLPEPISLKSEKTNVDKPDSDGLANLDSDGKELTDTKKKSTNKKKKSKLFGYFSFLEILVMAFGTLVTAAIIFIVLEYV